MNLFGEKQTCPAFLHLPVEASLIACYKSASKRTTKGSLPPNSITDFLRYFPAFSAINDPAFDDPVKLTPPTEF
jgi:hypothetical protein